MNPDSLQASFWVLIAIQTIGSVDMPGKGPRKLPAPRSYIAIVLTWAILQVVADAGRQRIASALGWLIVLTGMVVGPFGTQVVSLFNSVANQYGASPPTSPQG